MRKSKEEKKMHETIKTQTEETVQEPKDVKTENLSDQEASEKAPAEPPAGQPVMEAEKAEAEEKPSGPSLEQQLAEAQEKYLRLAADFDNYRKRMLRERMDLIKTAGEEVLVSFLPILDDIDRAMKSIRETQDLEAVKTGIELIYSKLKDFLTQKGIREIEALNQPFSTDFHEAITNIPVEDEDKKGKVVDVVQKGYTLYDKVVRYSKVVVGE